MLKFFYAAAWIVLLLANFVALFANAQGYTWKDVAMGGGGYITNIVAHPKEAGLLYARTDNGGAYRWDQAKQAWIPLTDLFGIGLQNYYGIDGIALDPNDPNTIYICAGKSANTPSAILKSTDRGASWHKLKDLLFEGNGDLRWIGEPIAVDPNNTKVIYSGSRSQGLHRSLDGGLTWSLISALPTGLVDIGIRTVAIDPTSVYNGRSKRVFVAVYGSGLYVSDDGGTSWAKVSGAPLKIHRMVVANDGTLYTSSASGVHRYVTGWSNISPKAAGFGALSVASDDPRKLIAIVDYKSSGVSAFELPIYYSENGGVSWVDISAKSTRSFMASWYNSQNFSAATASALFDPFSSSRVWFSDWYGTWRTEEITAPTVAWHQQIRGHEQMSVLSLISVPDPISGTSYLLSGVADNKGFRHDSLTQYPSHHYNHRMDTADLDFSESRPAEIFSVSHDGGAAYSLDHGNSWTKTTWPYGGSGRVAVSATDPRLAVVLPIGSSPKRTTDRGASWQSTTGAPSGAMMDRWDKQHPLASDRVNGSLFYFMHNNGDFYRSTNGGSTWLKTLTLSTGGMYMVNAAPGMPEEVWVSVEKVGLYRSSNAGSSFAKIPNVSAARLFAFGKNPEGKPHPTVFLYGTVGTTTGIFRSDDFGVSWLRINNDQNQFAANLKSMEGDRSITGRVFIGTGGRGIVYGVPSATTSPTPSPSPSPAPSPTATPSPAPSATPTASPSPTPTPSPTPSRKKISVQVSSSANDAEESSGGAVSTTSTDLELVYDASTQIVGIRFSNVQLPKGAKIVSASIQFLADESGSASTSLKIQGERKGYPSSFSTAKYNLSSRGRTSASVSWSNIPAWSSGSSGADQRTPNLAPIVQEVVNLADWAPGQAMVMIITGSGQRTAKAYDGSSTGAPVLVIEYE